MSRNSGVTDKGYSATSESVSSVFRTNSRDTLCEELNFPAQLRKFPLSASTRRADRSVTATLLGGGGATAAGVGGERSDCNGGEYKGRRDRVCRSWNGAHGYGTLVEEDSLSVLDSEHTSTDRGRSESLRALRSIGRAASSSLLATPYRQQQQQQQQQQRKPTAATDALDKCTRARRSGSRIDLLLMPSLRSLVSRRSGIRASSRAADMGGSSSSSVPVGSSAAAGTTMPLMKREGSCTSLAPSIRIGDHHGLISDVPSASDNSGMRKCETVLALSSLGAVLRSASSSGTTIHVEPLRPVNRLRVPPHLSTSTLSPGGGSTSRMCSRCSSLLSMASSSRYSLNTAGGGFAPCSPSTGVGEQLTLCKLCLGEVHLKNTCEILQCACSFCNECMKAYVEFEIQEGAYDISCPDAQCEKQGIITLSEIETLVSQDLVEKYKKFRLNREVDLDLTRTWCPRAGCETVCTVCPTERCLPQSVHCPTCTSDFCSNCKNPWHSGLACEENSKRLAKEGRTDLMESGIPFDSDLIKCCPMCNVPIEKDEGCAQMMCKRCKHVFCWYCLASLDDDFLLRHYDKGPCKNKLGHSRASVIWHRTQVIGIFAGFGILLLVASPLLLLAAPCIVCCKCRVCSGGSKLDSEDDMQEESAS